MSFYTSIFSLLKRKVSPKLYPFIIGFLLSLLVLYSSWISMQSEKLQQEMMIQRHANLLSDYIKADMRSRLPALERIVQRWIIRKGTPKKEFIEDTQHYIDHLLGFQAIEWVDKDFYVRWVVPIEGNEKALNLDLSFNKVRKESLEYSKTLNKPVMSKRITLVQGGEGFLIYFPIFIEKEFQGFILAVFRIDSWLDYVFNLQENKKEFSYFRASVSMNNYLSYQQKGWEKNYIKKFQKKTFISIMEQSFEISCHPTALFFKEKNTFIHKIILTIGFILVFLISVLIHLFQNSCYAIKKQKESEIKTQYLATHDGLTQLANRRSAITLLSQSLKIAKKHQQMMAVLFIDLDGFKQINDTYGHDIGDNVLIQISKLLLLTVRTSDHVARIGGDEFLILLNPIKDKNDIQKIAQKIIDKISEPLLCKEKNILPIQVGASIGIALYPKDAQEESSLIKYADKAMYHIKKSGKNHFCFYEDLNNSN